MTIDLTVTNHLLKLPDGRMLEWSACGPPDGAVLLHHHISPGGAVPQRRWARAAAARGLRLVTLARAGFGRSDSKTGRTLVDVAHDSAALLDALGVEKAFVSGSSGGGPFALACAVTFPSRVRAVTTIGGVGPFGVPDLDFLEGMSPDNREEHEAAIAGESSLRAMMEVVRPGLLAACADPVAMRSGFAQRLPPVDAEWLSAELTEDVSRGMIDALTPGPDGWTDDSLTFVRPWPLDLAPLAGVRVSIWHGEADRTIPVSHGRWYAKHIPGVRAHVLPAEGHISIGQRNADAIIADLVS